MRIINIVSIKNNILDEIESFGVFEEQLSEEIIDIAEKLFIEKAKKIGYDEEDNECLLDDGYYHNSYCNKSVCISWSDIEQNK